jgi:hypothetical protein
MHKSGVKDADLKENIVRTGRSELVLDFLGEVAEWLKAAA